MPVTLTNKDIGTRYALQEDFNNGFVGRDRQVVIQTDDPKGYRPVIMDGKTTGGKSKVALVADLADYLPKANPAFTGTLSGASGTFTGDLSGTNGTFTGTVSGASGTFTGTLSLNGDSVATQSTLTNSVNTKVNKTGDRGQLAGFETTHQESSNTITITESSPDCIIMTSEGNKTITVNSTAYSNAFCIKYVCCYVSSGTVTVNGLAGYFGGDPLEFGTNGWAIALVKSGANTWEGIPIGKW